MERMKTPLHAKHVALGGHMVEFAGYDMPVQYTGVLQEHQAVREGVGLFDVSHMGRVDVFGERALEFLQKTTCGDLFKLQDGRIKYSMFCRPDGGTLDDILVYRVEDEYMLVVNASNRAKILQHLSTLLTSGVSLLDRTETTAHLALQGPLADALLRTLTGDAPLPARYYSCVPELPVAGVPCFVSRNGYTGEDGYELICPAEQAETLWDALTAAGAVPCGLGARDTLRFEASMPLYGHELTENISPIQAGLSMFVSLDKCDFIGRDALANQVQFGVEQKRRGLLLHGKGMPRQGCRVFCGDTQVGTVTSGGLCPTIHQYCAMAMLDTDLENDSQLEIEIRTKRYPCDIVRMPFYKRGNA